MEKTKINYHKYYKVHLFPLISPNLCLHISLFSHEASEARAACFDAYLSWRRHAARPPFSVTFFDAMARLLSSVKLDVILGEVPER